jgi:hypothetical protein
VRGARKIAKEQMVAAIQSRPEGATVDDAVERLRFIELVEERLATADQGHVISHEEARRRFAEWLDSPGTTVPSTTSSRSAE